MSSPRLVLFAWIWIALAGFASAQDEVEPFARRGFTNRFFTHDFEFDDRQSWDIVEHTSGDWGLHLKPNTDFITFDLDPGTEAKAIQVSILDFEGGFVGTQPTSVVIARSSHGDFVPLSAQQIGVWTVLSADIFTPGKLTGQPLGDIVQIQLQAANEGNTLVPGVGAIFDDITVTTGPSPWVDLGNGTAGTHGVPLLEGEGGPIGGSQVSLTVTGALEDQSAVLVIGLSRIDAPTLGGILVPSPDFLIGGLTTTSAGELVVTTDWPQGIPPSTTVFFQVWIVDPAGPKGLSATNGLSVTTPE